MKSLASVLLIFIGSFGLQAQVSQLESALAKAESKGYSGVMLVADKGEIIFEKAVGLRSFEEKIPLETTDLFEMASVSKQFTAMMVMMCKEKGLLNFDDPAEKFIRIPYPNISIRQLLTHTSGLPDYQAIMDEHWDKSKAAGNPDILEYLRRYAPPKLFEPGEKYEYSNTGYVILASIVEEVTGKDFVELSNEWIFDPVGMNHTAIRSLEEKAQVPNFAAGHLKDHNGTYINANQFRSSDYTLWLGNRKGPGRVSSTAQDLLRWDQALYGEKLVGRETLEEAFTPTKLNDATKSNYGFGWDIEPKSPLGKMVSHTGDNPGYQTIIVRFIEENKTIILLNNNYHPEHDALVEAAKKALSKK
ncbi:serine hydrolase domain-containing protein [Algoriphagus hitonicola]|uniref:CubicO group peptidase, beta-lactamase class C family n=1 Tax=Algoriphagus hitonicola TaxID=435880 RepID=A0A1I2QBV3_9BACT|nr:serine hydrolase domain-containing protein [Algoriphagus hitonicola]SFG23757.1 CubicO group peptidase, beta-lactamase class C family [Algoriphagus hitonicola]